MAMIKLQMGFSDIKGKLNGSYFQSQKGGISCKTISPRRSKATTFQAGKQVAQQNLAYVARLWGQLSPENVLAWNSYATGFTRYNKIGEPYTPTGYQMFNEVNQTLAAQGGGMILFPVEPNEPQDINTFNVVWSIEQGFHLTSTIEITAGKEVWVYATAPQYGNKAFPRTAYRLIAKVVPADLLPYLLDTNLVAAWGVVPAGSQVFFRVKMVDVDSGIQQGSKLTKADAGFA